MTLGLVRRPPRKSASDRDGPGRVGRRRRVAAARPRLRPAAGAPRAPRRGPAPPRRVLTAHSPRVTGAPRALERVRDVHAPRRDDRSSGGAVRRAPRRARRARAPSPRRVAGGRRRGSRRGRARRSARTQPVQQRLHPLGRRHVVRDDRRARRGHRERERAHDPRAVLAGRAVARAWRRRRARRRAARRPSSPAGRAGSRDQRARRASPPTRRCGAARSTASRPTRPRPCARGFR